MTSQTDQNESQSFRIDADTADEESVNFDLDRMKKAIDGTSRRVPEDLSGNQFIDWMINPEGEFEDD